ncbi:MAG: sterol carrier family protein [Propionicimonas sp.]|uniref:sterol carrier family protein n=1 Tax=Propionicimonas sp. TaxID=1955623 RepID=UPI003D1351C4
MARTPTQAQVDELRHAIRALDDEPAGELPRATLAAASRTICGLLAARYPGGSVELRVPPFAAVQLGIGERGRHTRGTPPNVVQTDAATLLRLASGALAWPDALATHQVRASGIHSDLAELWPLPELR